MSVNRYLEELPMHKLTKFKIAGHAPKNCVAFTGSPKRHPYDEERIILILSPFSSSTTFLEFKFEDIAGYENIPSLATESGSSISMITIWVQKGSIGVKHQPFEVDEPLRYFQDSEVLTQNTSE